MRKHTGIKPQGKSGYICRYCKNCGKEIPRSRTYYGNIDKYTRIYCRSCENRFWKGLLDIKPPKL